MARVSGPLFSMSASGTIGKALTYGAWKGIAWVRTWFSPANPQSAQQVNVRTAMTLIVAYWGTLSDEYKALFNTFAEGTGMSGYNQLCKRALDAYITDHGVDIVVTAVSVVGDPPVDVWTWTPAV